MGVSPARGRGGDVPTPQSHPYILLGIWDRVAENPKPDNDETECRNRLRVFSPPNERQVWASWVV